MTQLSEHENAGISGLLMQMRRLIHAYIEEKDYELPEGEKPLIAAVLHAVDSAYLNLDPDPMGDLTSVEPLAHLEGTLVHLRHMKSV